MTRDELLGEDTLVSVLRHISGAEPSKLAFVFLQDGEAEGDRWTYGDLDARARAIAVSLREGGEKGDRVIVACPAGLHFIGALLGCVYAGMVPVPVHLSMTAGTAARLSATADDAGASALLTTSQVLEIAGDLLAKEPRLAQLRALAVDLVPEGRAEAWSDPGVSPDSLALLQYTSGSTSAPRGVEVSHRNILANERMIQRAFGYQRDHVGVGWLPMFHDMGLIGNVLQPLFTGSTCVLMAPEAFLARPIRWLSAISRYKARFSGGPSFAYQLCVRRTTPEEREGLDLSSWELAFNGAEPVRAEALQRFAEVFRRYGFREEAFYPCYGLAEATLFVSGGQPGAGPVLRSFDAEALSRGRAVPGYPGDAGARTIVGCGRPSPEEELITVDPESREVREDGRVGEVWLAGPNVARGYWNKPEETERAFRAATAGSSERRYLRTGDLGFRLAGELFITGRLKDLIILRGRNYYPQDIEAAIERCSAALRPGCSAAFTVEIEQEDRVVLVQEVRDEGLGREASEEILWAIRRAASDACQVQLHAVVLIAPHSIPKTTSGKVRRRRCREAFEAGELRVVAAWREAPAAAREGARPAPVAQVEEWLLGALAEQLSVDASRLSKTEPLSHQGLDSMGSLDLLSALEERYGARLSLYAPLAGQTIASLARAVAEAKPRGDLEAGPSEETYDELSSGERALWVECRMASMPAAYNTASVLRLPGGTDLAALQRALGGLIEHHPSLRTTFDEVGGSPRRRVRSTMGLPVAMIDADGWTPARLDEAIAKIVREPFDLRRGPLLRVAIITRAVEPPTLVLAVHHLLVDHGSQEICLSDLSSLYATEMDGVPRPLSKPRSHPASYARRQRALLEGAEGERLFAYWRDRLAGAVPFLDIPIDRPRPPVRGYRADTSRFTIPRAIALRARALCRERGVTLYTALLAAFQLLLHRESGQRDLVVGTPAACRGAAERDVVGYFVNLLPLRAEISLDLTFNALLDRTGQSVVGALLHCEYPFDRLVDRLSPPRDPSRPPLVQAVFVMHQPRRRAPQASAASGPLEEPWRSVPVDQPGAPFEIVLTVVDGEGDLEAFFTYDAALFEPSTIDGASQRYLALLGWAVHHPEARLDASLRSVEAPRAAQISERVSAREEGLHESFSEQVRRTPSRVALSSGDEHLTYEELDRRASRVARHLRDLGASAETRVGLCVERSIDAIVGLLGILKSGGAYVPMSPRLPAERIALLLRDAGATIVVSQELLLPLLPREATCLCLDRLPDGPASEAPPAKSAPSSLAYVIFTSGSTGRPKGVGVEHRQAQALFAAAQPTFEFGPDDVWTLFHSLSFDFSVWEIWGALLHGGRLVIVPYEVSRSPVELLALLRREGVTVLNQVPSAFRLLVDAEEQGEAPPAPELRWIIFGGGPLDFPSLRAWAGRHGVERPALVNMYGITETTVHVTLRRLREADIEEPGRQNIGRPLPHLHCQVMLDDGTPAPTGARGELYVGGAGVSRGYLGQPGWTAARFVPDPFSDAPGARLYRSGDLGRLLPSGDIEYLGRIDHQVQVRGHRVEPGEIEGALRSHSAVREAVVIGWDPEAPTGVAEGSAAGVSRLLSYVEIPGDPPSVDALRAHVAARLPAYMVPSAFVILREMPRTSGGKPDRRALPPPPRLRPELSQGFVAPETELERTIAGIWCDVLELDEVGIEDDFFALGGDSIRALQVVSRCRESGVEVSAGQIFRAPRIRELCEVIAGAPRPLASLAPFALVPEALRAELPRSAVDAYPVTMLQSVLLHQSRSSRVYEVYVTSLLVRAPFDPAAMRRALEDLVAHHAMLRTSFDLRRPSDPLQIVHESAEVPLTWEDLSSVSLEEADARVLAWMTSERRRPFDWTEAPLLRVHMHRRAGDTFHVSLTEPFLDGWSVASLVTELLDLYQAYARGIAPRRYDITASYALFVQRELEAIAHDRPFWGERVLALPECPLPSLSPAETRDAEGGPRRIAARVSESVTARILDLSRARSLPVKHILLAAHLRAVGYLCGVTGVVTGVMMNARPDVAGAERILGIFLNTLPLSVDLSGHTWMSLAAEAFVWEREVLPHRWLPFAELQRLRASSPLFEVAFNYTHFHVFRALDRLDGIKVLDWSAADQTYFPMSAQLNHDSFTSSLRIALDYDPKRLSPAFMDRALGAYLRALEALAERPDDPVLSARLMSGEERQKLLVTWNDTAASWQGPERIHELFEERARRRPDALALITDRGSVTFAALDERANQLAHHVLAAGVRAEERVAIFLARSVESVVAMLGILKAGGAYVPLDPAYPDERIAFILRDAGVRVVVTDSALASRLAAFDGTCVRVDEDREAIARRPATAPATDRAAGELAYVLYTSGSTGTPKGVLGLHRGAVNRMRWMYERFPFTEGDVVCLKTSLGFGDSIWETFGPLCAGIPAAVIPDEIARDGLALAEAIARFRVTHLVLVPSLLSVFLDVVPADVLSGVRFWVSSGEALPTSLAQRFAAKLPKATLLNLYGSTEVSADVTWHDTSRAMEGPIAPCGRPIANTRIFVLDDEMEPVPEGLTGEIYVGGVSVARGYQGRPGLTAARFVADPFSEEPGARLYRTGDLGRYLSDGSLEYLGRRDQQIKIRGQRVEMSEVSTRLAEHPSVAEAVCHAWSDASGELELAGYAVLREGESATSDELREHLERYLAGYMVPAELMILAELPRTSGGKVDRTSLPRPERQRFSFEQDFEAPSTETEIAIASIWSELLGVEAVGVHDNFIQLGGHSLLATRLLARVREAFGVDLSLRSLLERQTVAGLAAAVDAAKAFSAAALEEPGFVPASPSVPAMRPRLDKTGPFPLSVTQRSVWYESQRAPESPAYNIPASVRLRGPLDLGALSGALAALSRRHTALRSIVRLTDDGLRGELLDVELRPVIEEAAVPEAERRAAISSRTEEETRRPFDLARDPPIRARIVRLAPDDHLLLVTIHHIAGDEWSLGVLIQEINELYAALHEGRAPRLAEPGLDYADFAAFQAEQIAKGALDADLAYWARRLEGAPPEVTMRADRPRARGHRFEGASLLFSLSPATSRGLRQLARAHEATLFMALLAVFATLLHHDTGEKDLVIGTDLAQRDRAELERIVGLLVNQAALRVDLSGEPSFAGILARVREATLQALDHKDVPFAKVVEALRTAPDPSRSPLFQVKLVLQTAPLPAWALPGLSVEVIPVDTRSAKFDLLMNLWDAALGTSEALPAELAPAEKAIAGVVEYDTALFEERTIKRLLARFELLGSRVAEQPDAPLATMRAWLTEADAADRARARSRGRDGLGAALPRPVPIDEE